MNLILLFDDDFIDDGRVRLMGRRLQHVAAVHRAVVGDHLVVGLLDGPIGRGTITALDEGKLEMEVILDRDPPPPLALTLVLALPRPKVLNRVVAGIASLGVKRLFLINAWRVEKSYWKSPRLARENLRTQAILGLEQARDTYLPVIETAPFFRNFVEDVLPGIVAGSRALVAHPRAARTCPRSAEGPMTLAIGPEGGFIDEEIESLQGVGFEAVSIGERILRVETVIPAIIGRLF